MHLAPYFVAVGAILGVRGIYCPSRSMDYDVVRRAIDYEETARNRLVRRSDINVDIYLHNVASGPTWDNGYVSVSLIAANYCIRSPTH